MKGPTTKSNLSSFVGLLACAVAACSGVDQDGFVTVGVRPTHGLAASGGNASGAAGLPVPKDGSDDVMSQLLDGDSTSGRDVTTIEVAPAPADTSVTAGSEAADIRTNTESFPAEAIADDASAGSGAAGADGSASYEDECGAIPAESTSDVASSSRVSGLVGYEVNAPAVFTRLRTTLAVPAEPAPNGQVYIWSGIQPTPSSTNLQPIGNGGLLPVLTWGPSCAPDAPPSYSTWWIAPMYSNISSSDPQYSGCHTGTVVLAQPEQLIDIEIRLEGSEWVQSVVNRETMEASEFSIDLDGQAQGRAFFNIELQTNNKPTEDVVFTHTVLTMDASAPEACQPFLRGMNDYAAQPRISADGRHCCIDRIVLRAPGVEATTIDPP